MRRPAGMTSRPMPSPGMRPARYQPQHASGRREDPLHTDTKRSGGHSCNGICSNGNVRFPLSAFHFPLPQTTFQSAQPMVGAEVGRKSLLISGYCQAPCRVTKLGYVLFRADLT